MGKAVHIMKQSQGSWAVKRSGGQRASSVHKTQAEALASARRLALRSGGAEVIIHRADGRIRDRDTIGAAKIDESKVEPGSSPKSRQGAGPRRREPSRAPRSDGPRTTLRLPESLAEVADQLAAELHVSRNDALLRLATHGARVYEQERAIQEARDRRWAAVIPGIVDIDQADLPCPEEARDAVLASREELFDATDV